jgi:hypothetical protein
MADVTAKTRAAMTLATKIPIARKLSTSPDGALVP